ncbi:hypothetical protein KIN20_020272 [Parelaphostrongylus tenuis]|uniref:Uncharacterized protein n=1 Tax=Parelaphostrongylus tenuis TaxID=148309 RepID=A0AAD5MM67_PARTN|nr:hypothetical protein KIN20_020272 [Parelaphostrongylus tenuis]
MRLFPQQKFSQVIRKRTEKTVDSHRTSNHQKPSHISQMEKKDAVLNFKLSKMSQPDTNCVLATNDYKNTT